jgi:small subunit ribosomal protein S8
MLTRLRNASAGGRETVDIPHSRLKGEVARVLKKEGFIADYATESQGGRRVLRVYLRYGAQQQPVLRGIRRISRPGCRVYATAERSPRVLNGLGVAILTTSGGIMTDREARRAHVGGEVLCHVW